MVTIIAEAGVNHNGDMSIAKELIEKAAEAQADIVKFQTFQGKHLVSKGAEKAAYQKETTDIQETQLDMIKKLELSLDQHHLLMAHCQKKQIQFLSTPFDLESIALLSQLGLDTFKIPSGEITNLPYLEKIAKLKKKVILSTGMSNLGEVESAVTILNKFGTTDITLLHCTTEYPAPYEDVNLRAMVTLKQAFGLPVGYSDHTKGIEVSVAAVAMGATLIEKHFTLDKNMEGPDHKASLDPEELTQLVRSIRHIEKAMGEGRKKVSTAEEKNMVIARKSIIAKTVIKKGEAFTEENLTTKRPGSGISPMRWYEVLGSVASRDYGEDELIDGIAESVGI